MPTYRCRNCSHRFTGPPGQPCPACLASRRACGRGGAGATATSRARTVGEGAWGPQRPADSITPQTGAIEGRVLQTSGPVPVEGRRDGWQLACLPLLFVALLPALLALWLVSIAWRLVLSLAGIRLGRGGGLLGDILAFQLLGRAFQAPEPIPVYDHVIDTGAGLVHARQEGEFQDGRIFTGNRVALRGVWRGGAFVIHEGANASLGTRLAFKTSAWRVAFGLLVLVVMVEGFLLAALLAPGLAAR